MSKLAPIVLGLSLVSFSVGCAEQKGPKKDDDKKADKDKKDAKKKDDKK